MRHYTTLTTTTTTATTTTITTTTTTTTIHNTTLQLQLHYTNCITLHYTTLHYTTLIALHYTTLHSITLHYAALAYPTLHYITLHYVTWHYITLQRTHYTTTYATATTLHELYHTITTTPLHYNYNYSCATPHYIQQLWVRWRARWPLQPLQPLQKTQLQPPFGPSVDSLCHPWFTTANLSYRFPIFETSATALCGTTGKDTYPIINLCSLVLVFLCTIYHNLFFVVLEATRKWIWYCATFAMFETPRFMATCLGKMLSNHMIHKFIYLQGRKLQWTLQSVWAPWDFVHGWSTAKKHWLLGSKASSQDGLAVGTLGALGAWFWMGASDLEFNSWKMLSSPTSLWFSIAETDNW